MSKGAALAELCDRWGISLSGLMTFGNGHNDISMFNEANVSFAMLNGHPEVVEEADYAVESFAEAVDMIMKKDI